METDAFLYKGLALALRFGVVASLILMVTGLALSTTAPSPSLWLIRAGIIAVLSLPALQAGVALVSYHRAGNRRFAAVALTLLVVQAGAVLVAFC